MGQRHQVYVRLPKDKNKRSRIVGLHHQYLLGERAVRSLSNFLKRCAEEDNLTPQSAFQALKEEYGTNILNDRVIADPRKVDDNDNGITVIDLSGETPKICFLALWGMQGEDEHVNVAHPGEYDYDPDDYPHFHFYKNFKPISVVHWLVIYHGEVYENIKDAAEYLNQFGELDVSELCDIFPDMKDSDALKGLHFDANSFRFIMEDEPEKVVSKRRVVSKQVVKTKGKRKIKNPKNLTQIEI